MLWRAFLAWYDGQIGVQGVFHSEEEARLAARAAVENWRLGKGFPEWMYEDFGRTEPEIVLCAVEPASEEPEDMRFARRFAPRHNMPLR